MQRNTSADAAHVLVFLARAMREQSARWVSRELITEEEVADYRQRVAEFKEQHPGLDPELASQLDDVVSDMEKALQQ